jgi:hypothetical protein
VQVQRVTGDLLGGDLGAGALDVIVDAEILDADGKLVTLKDMPFDAGEPTENPLPTTGARAPEPLGEELARAVRRELAKRVVPVTLRDYEDVLRERIRGVAEVKATVTRRPGRPEKAAKERVDVVIRPRPGEEPARVLREARALLREARLAGTDVWARLCEPLFVSLEILVEVHPESDDDDVRARLRKSLLALFGDGGDRLLGRERTSAEVYAAIEKVPGVVWGQVTGFDVAGAREEVKDTGDNKANTDTPGTREEIAPEPHQILRCLDLPDVPLGGRIQIWVARRFRLVLDIGYADPDVYEREQIQKDIMNLFPCCGASPVLRCWPEITAAQIDGVLPRGDGYRVSARSIIVGDRAVERVPLKKGELPIVDSVQLRERGFGPHFSLGMNRAGEGSDPAIGRELDNEIRRLLSGPESKLVKERWSEITLSLLHGLFARELPSHADALELSALLVGEESVERVELTKGDVPILDRIRSPYPSALPRWRRT